MSQDQIDRIAKLLERISDRSERTEITREIAKVLGDSQQDFEAARFYQMAQVEDPA